MLIWMWVGAARAAPVRLLLDAGHGAEDNRGNIGLFGQVEAEEMASLARALLALLQAQTPEVVVTLTRPDHRLVSYDRRLELCAGQDLLLSLHSDSRWGVMSWDLPPLGVLAGEPEPLWENTGAQGFAILVSDEGPADLAAARLHWAQALARRMVEEGFQPYLGLDYGALADGGLYAADPSPVPVPGVFVDRHAPGQRIRLLRRPQIPSLIVETHEAHDRSEVLWWSEGSTQAAFARAILRSIDDIHLGGNVIPPKDLPTGAE